MSLLHFRTLAGLLFVVIAYVLLEIHFTEMDIPDMAVSYILWWRAQPLNTLEGLALQYGTLTHALLLLSLVGVALLWSPARYLFTITMLFAIIREAFFSLPLVVVGRSVVLDNLIALLAGMLVFAMFFTPLRNSFVKNPFRARGSSAAR